MPYTFSCEYQCGCNQSEVTIKGESHRFDIDVTFDVNSEDLYLLKSLLSEPTPPTDAEDTCVSSDEDDGFCVMNTNLDLKHYSCESERFKYYREKNIRYLVIKKNDYEENIVTLKRYQIIFDFATYVCKHYFDC